MKITRAEYERLSPVEKQRIITESTPEELSALMGTVPADKPKPIERLPAPVKPLRAEGPVKEKVIQTNLKQGALFGGWVCFGLGLVFMSMGLILFCILYVPLFLASFILSIIAMAQRRVLGGVTLLIVTIIIPPVFGLIWADYRLGETADSIQQYADKLPKHSDASTPESSPPVSTTPAIAVKQPEAPPKPKHPALDQKMGFREYRLGTSFFDFNLDVLDKREAYMKTDMKIYTVKNFDRYIGGSQIDEIQLNFLQDILQSIRVTVTGEQNALGLKEALIAAYGKPDEDDSFINETLTWNGDDCVLQLLIESDTGATADFTSKSVDAKIKAITEQKAKAGAAAGSKDL